MANVTINQKVSTPLGEGVVRGQFRVIDPQTGSLISKAFTVEIPVNDVTRPHLNQSNCMTSHATQSGVWVFQESELT